MTSYIEIDKALFDISDGDYCDPAPECSSIKACIRLPWDYMCDCGDFQEVDESGHHCVGKNALTISARGRFLTSASVV